MSIRERGSGGFRERKDPLKNNPKAQFLFDAAVNASLGYRESTRNADLFGQHDHKVTYKAAEALLREHYVVDTKGHPTDKLIGTEFGSWEFWNKKIAGEVRKREEIMRKEREAAWRAEIAKGLSPVDKVVFAIKRKNPELTKKQKAFDDVEKVAKEIRDDETITDFEERILTLPIDRSPRVIFEDMDIAEAKKALMRSFHDSNNPPKNNRKKFM